MVCYLCVLFTFVLHIWFVNLGCLGGRSAMLRKKSMVLKFKTEELVAAVLPLSPMSSNGSNLQIVHFKTINCLICLRFTTRGVSSAARFRKFLCFVIIFCMFFFCCYSELLFTHRVLTDNGFLMGEFHSTLHWFPFHPYTGRDCRSYTSFRTYSGRPCVVFSIYWSVWLYYFIF